MERTDIAMQWYVECQLHYTIVLLFLLCSTTCPLASSYMLPVYYLPIVLTIGINNIE